MRRYRGAGRRENGVLTVMCGGDEADYARPSRDRPLLAHAQIVGTAGIRTARQDVQPDRIAGLVQGLAEAIHFGMKAGLDMEAVIDVISKGAAGSWQMENRYKSMIAAKFDFGFAVDWMRKDLGICLDQAQ